jgi:hypothetical protein
MCNNTPDNTPDFDAAIEQLSLEGQLIVRVATRNVSAVRAAFSKAKRKYNERLGEDRDTRRIVSTITPDRKGYVFLTLELVEPKTTRVRKNNISFEIITGVKPATPETDSVSDNEELN